MTPLDHTQDSARSMRERAERQARDHHADDQAVWLSMYTATSGQSLAGMLAETDDPLEAERVIGALDREALEAIAFGAAFTRRTHLAETFGAARWSWPTAETG